MLKRLHPAKFTKFVIYKVHSWKWCRNFASGKQSVHDEEWSSHPSVITEAIGDSVKDHYRQMYNNWWVVQGSSTGFKECNARDCSQMSQICVRLVPKTTELFGASLELITHYNKDGEDFLDRIVSSVGNVECKLTPICEENVENSIQRQ